MAESDAALAKLVAAHPDSHYAAEAEFRRAEQAFNSRRYAEAEASYGRVAAAGKATPFYLNAIYMQGWSAFKRSHSQDAIAAFTQVLDLLLPQGTELAALPGGKKNLAEDTLRVLSYTFAYLEGAPAVTQAYKTLGQRPYQPLIYGQLAEYYLDKKRYKDSAETYQHFITQFPDNNLGPDFFVRMIEVYQLGGFPSEILPAKEAYVANYGITSQFWQARSSAQQDTLRPHLKTFLDELSSHYHAAAQAQQKAAAPTPKKAKDKNAEPAAVAPDSAVSLYLKAAGYYQQFVATFPNDPALPAMTFLMAEAYNDAGSKAEAVKAYEQVAYTQKDAARGPEAGYAALITLQQLVTSTTGASQTQWQAQKNRSAIAFAEAFPKDPRAVNGLASAADDLFKQGDKPAAMALATRITQWQPAAAPELQKTAWLVIAHCQFDQQHYAQAEEAYRKTLALMPAGDDKRKDISEHIAASMYKAAEGKTAPQEQTAAIDQLLQISSVAPGSDIAIKAQYDAANQLLELKQWQRTEQVLTDFVRRYPQHPLTPSVAPKLAVIYQELQQWDKAADALAVMSKSDSNPDARRNSLFLSAELSRKAGRLPDAISRYTDYVKTYPAPFDVATEARFQLMELTAKQGDKKASASWQQSLVDADARAGSQRTARSRFLAAAASSQVADEQLRNFQAVRLSAPLKDSIKVKRAAMDTALASYKKIIDYGVPEFATAANHHIGEIYAQLFSDLKKSERPAGLDDLALEQYDIMLDEQATPFKEKAVSLLSANAERAQQGIYDEWVKKSYDELAKLLPARYGKKEKILEVSDGLE